MNGKRIFAAVELSDDARAGIASHIDKLRSEFAHLRVGWERPEKLHITVYFTGDIDLAEIKNFLIRADETARSCALFSTVLFGTGAFIKPRGSNVLWIGTKADGLAVLAEGLYKRNEPAASRKAQRKFSPHLTIARLRDPANSMALIEQHLASPFGPVEFPVTELTVFESELMPTGSVYRVVDRFPMASK